MNCNLEDILFEGEQVLWQDKPNKKCYVWRAISQMLMPALLWVFVDGGIIAMIITQGGMDPGMWPILVGFFALHLAPVWIFIGKLIKAKAEYENVVYAITDKRVIVRSGLVGIDFDTINYTDISNVNTNVSVIERMCSVGSVFVHTSSGKTVCIASVENPYQVAKTLNKVFMDVHSDIQYPNAYRPDSNPGYNSKYTPR